MPALITLATLLVALFILLGSGLYVAFGLAGVGILGLELLADAGGIIGATMYNALSSYPLSAIPLFMIMGQIVLHGGLSDRLYHGVSQWTRIIPGGLTHSNILSCSLFAAVSGSSLATAATIGTVAYPAQTGRGYNASLVTGSLAAGGTLGILIPPSINMIVYGAFVGVSVGKLFIGGVIPGFGLAALFMTYILFAAVINPSLGPAPDKIRWRYFLEAVTAFKDIWPMLLIILTIIGGIYGGLMTPTEAAGISALIALVITAAYRRLNLNMLKKSAVAALRTSAMVLVLVMAAQVLGAAVSMLRIPAQLCEMVVEAELSRYVVWFAVVFIVIILGCFMDGLSIMLFTLPVLFPLLVTTLGFHPLVVGIFMVLQAECALITPPVGLNLYIIHGIAKGTDMMTVIKGAIPFFVLMLVMIVLITYLPEMVLFLPGMMIGR